MNTTKKCTRCDRVLPLDSFGFRSRASGKRAGRCLECAAEVQRIYRANYPEKQRELRVSRHATAYHRNWHLQRVYGMSSADYEALYRRQAGRCAVCGCAVEDGKLHVDHDHTTGRVRGLLCQKCNRGIGLFNDSPQRLRAAAEYCEVDELPGGSVAA